MLKRLIEQLRPIWADPLWLFIFLILIGGMGYYKFYYAPPVELVAVDWRGEGIRITVIQNDGYCSEVVSDEAESHADAILAILAQNDGPRPVLISEVQLEAYLASDVDRSNNQLLEGEDSTFRVDITLGLNSVVESCIYQPAMAEEQRTNPDIVWVARVTAAEWLDESADE